MPSPASTAFRSSKTARRVSARSIAAGAPARLSEVGSTSFFPSKPLGCYGDGGALFTDDDALAKVMREIRVHGQDRRYHHPRLGINGRLDTLQAAVLLAKLEIFDDEVDGPHAHRRALQRDDRRGLQRSGGAGAPRDDAAARARLHERLRAVHDRSGESRKSRAGA